MSDTVTSTIRKTAGRAIFMGILTAAAGAAMILFPMTTATVTALFFGGALLVAAITTCIFAFQSAGPGPFFLKVLLSIAHRRRQQDPLRRQQVSTARQRLTLVITSPP